MNKLQLVWHKYKYFPYERLLAEREVSSLFTGKIDVQSNRVTVINTPENENAVARLTYFQVAECLGNQVVPDQAKLEASASSNGTTWYPEIDPIPQLRRQSTRYSAHGLHEYRGKFNPQVVRSIGNILGLQRGAYLLDPFCGSGTTVLESAHIGWNCIGIDINPLGVMIANAKVAAFKADPIELQDASERLASQLENKSSEGNDWQVYLPTSDYLEQWFTVPVLKQLCRILRAIDAVKNSSFRDIFRVIVSDIIRDVSLQDPGDLRIRRRKNPALDYPAVDLFVQGIRSKIPSVLRARRFVSPDDSSAQKAFFGDSRTVTSTIRQTLAESHRRTFDAAITSPPYATALPYMDTQRLSLAVLGLIEPRDLRSKEKGMIGNREITDLQRRRLEGEITRNDGKLPADVHSFCMTLLELANDPNHGFRRRNVPALVYKYLTDMAEMFESVHGLIKRGGKYALLVGRNATTLKGKEIEINTPQLLASIAASRSWEVEELLPFETYQRFHVHKNNSITSENLVVLKRI
jgi:tRNA G10  N-methylase Trm11